MNLFDIMRGAGDGDAFQALASRFGMSQDDVARAVQAFLPAFSAGLKRSTADPFSVMEFMRRLATIDYPQAYKRPDWAFGAGQKSGHDALGFLFGSPDAAKALAAQASAFTGLAQEKLVELMPALAAIMFGGLASQSAAANPLMGAMFKQARAGETEPGGKGPLDRYEEEQESSVSGVGDLARAQGEFLQAGIGAFQAGAAAWQDAVGQMMKTAGGGAMARAGGPPVAQTSGRDLFGEMFEPGVRLGEAYQREMESLLDRFRPDTSRS